MKRRHFTALAGLAFCGGTLANAAKSALPDTARVLVVGDSLSAEYGLRRGSGWVQILQQRMEQEGIPARMINAGISGDTTAGGRSRLPGLLKVHKPSVVVIELGANDALRGLPLSMTRNNLGVMSKAAKAAGAKVVLVGMQVPPNYGGQYTRDFQSVFRQVAEAEKTALVPFLLKGVADLPDPTLLFQEDRIHPNESAQATLADNVWPVLRPLLPKR
ncbi:MAG: arylesterase [Hydrogenophaga sp.]|nr:arylesterase [Hydrogenophaga sp.]